ncbi:MAG: NYN domain-containing protein [Bacteroidetes bacterium]|jgi:hypothetical protein|nr:NYN domain-containing protein [Bacteroidota bacterium]
MRYSNPDTESAPPQRAAVFVDYENLHYKMAQRVGQRDHPDELITEMLDELRRYLQEENATQTAIVTAYADFSDLKGNGQYIQRALYMQGIETRFVPATLQRNAAEIQLCVDAIDTVHNRPDIQMFVLVTGDRPYLPVVQQFKRYGRLALVASLNPPPSTDNLPYVEDDVFFDALNLLSENSRRAVKYDDSRNNGESATPPERPEPVEHMPLEGFGPRRTLEVIEEHFGQYEEVYLTPLLRKLSEVLDENRFDPKSLISELEDAGAVWLEKRRGFPYDYTVLIVDVEHPDVQEVQSAYYERQGESYDEEYDEYEDPGDGYYDDFEEYDDAESEADAEHSVEDLYDDEFDDRDA